MDKKQKILDFIKKQTHAVVATVNEDNKPEAALVGFGEADDLSLIFGTSTRTRKYKNIQKNPDIAVTISTETTSVQYEGRIVPFEEGELETYKKLYFTKTPSSQEYENLPDEIYLKIIPHWIRFVDFSPDPSEEFEIIF